MISGRESGQQELAKSLRALGFSQLKLWFVKCLFLAVWKQIGLARSNSLTITPGRRSKFLLMILTNSSDVRSEVP
jgi:hypothetical protein